MKKTRPHQHGKYSAPLISASQTLLRFGTYTLIACFGLFIVSFSVMIASLGTVTTQDTAPMEVMLTVALRGIQLLPFVFLVLVALQWRAITQRSVRRAYLWLAMSAVALCSLEVVRMITMYQMEISSVDGEIETYQASGIGVLYMPVFIALNTIMIVSAFRFLRQAKGELGI